MRKKQKLLLATEQPPSDDEVMSTPVPTNKSVVTLTASTNITAPMSEKTAATAKRFTEAFAFSPSTPTPSKQILENNRKKRRSSFAVVDPSNSSSNNNESTSNPNSSVMRTQLPPENVKTFEYHRHIETELPGPVKMRQLMIWACKKANGSNNDTTATAVISDKLVNALVNNEITTTWYQRPINNNANDDTSAVYYLPNPQNQELTECIELYKSYHQKLEKECETWESLKLVSNTSKSVKSSVNQPPIPTEIDNSLNVLFAEEFQNMNKWLNSLPLSIDRFDWNTKLALSFQDHAKQFCEGVFHQIFAKFFSADLPRVGKNNQRIEPMMLLRALSTNQSITN